MNYTRYITNQLAFVLYHLEHSFIPDVIEHDPYTLLVVINPIGPYPLVQRLQIAPGSQTPRHSQESGASDPFFPTT